MTARYVFIGVSLLCSLVLFLQVCFHPRWAFKQTGHSKGLWFLASFGSFFVLLGIPVMLLYFIRVGRDVERADAVHVQAFRERRAQNAVIRQEVKSEVQRQKWQGP